MKKESEYNAGSDLLIVIPARYASSRFPGKPLVDIGGKSMIRRTYEQASKTGGSVWVATDDERIVVHVESFGGKVLLTSDQHTSGTDRCAEALNTLHTKGLVHPKVVLNVQGDEPFIDPADILLVAELFRHKETDIGTLVTPFRDKADVADPNKVKVALADTGRCLYFSRSQVPFLRNPEGHEAHVFYRHIGLYGFRPEVLKAVSELKPARLEIAESLEQLRWLENGYNISAATTRSSSPSVDSPDDLNNLKPYL